MPATLDRERCRFICSNRMLQKNADTLRSKQANKNIFLMVFRDEMMDYKGELRLVL